MVSPAPWAGAQSQQLVRGARRGRGLRTRLAVAGRVFCPHLEVRAEESQRGSLLWNSSPRCAGFGDHLGVGGAEPCPAPSALPGHGTSVCPLFLPAPPGPSRPSRRGTSILPPPVVPRAWHPSPAAGRGLAGVRVRALWGQAGGQERLERPCCPWPGWGQPRGSRECER